MPYCENCGNKLTDTAKFCNKCGREVNKSDEKQNKSMPNTYPNQFQEYTQQNNQYVNHQYKQPVYTQQYYSQQAVPGVVYPETPLEKLRSKLKVEMIIWIVIASLQICLALWYFLIADSLSSYSYTRDSVGGYIFCGITLLIVAFINYIASYKRYKTRNRIKQTPTCIVEEYSPIAGFVVNLIYNVLFGGIFGIVGSIYGLTVRNYVMKYKNYFISIEKETLRKDSGESWYCPRCGRVNYGYDEVCTCGTKKPQGTSDEWVCLKCKRTNANYVTTCICGQTKDDNHPLQNSYCNECDTKQTASDNNQGNSDVESSQRYCENCGVEIADDFIYCPYCGYKQVTKLYR